MKAHELWESDITYIPHKERFAYLFLITHSYCRKIVGFYVSDDMKVSSAAYILNNILIYKHIETTLIHRNDRGIQYCSTEYVALLQQPHTLSLCDTEWSPTGKCYSRKGKWFTKNRVD